MNLWPVEHFCPPFFSRSALNWSEVHFYRTTSYKIHTLNAIGIVKYTILDGDAKFVQNRRAFDKAVGKVIIHQ